MHMSPVPQDMQAFAPLDGVDSRYGQLHQPINSETYKQGGIDGFIPTNPFKGFKFCHDSMQMAPAAVPQSCVSSPPIPFMPCLDELNDWLMQDRKDSWTKEESEAAMYPPKPPCLNVQAIQALKPKPVTRLTMNQLHAKLMNGQDNLFFVVFEEEWRPVGVAYKDTMTLHPECLQDDKLLVDVYILHPKDY